MSDFHTTSFRRAGALLAGAITVCGLLAWVAWDGDAGTTIHVEPIAETPQSGASAELGTTPVGSGRNETDQRTGFYTAPVGTVLGYEFDSSFEYALIHPEGGRHASGFGMRAALDVAVADRRDEEILVEVALRDVVVQPGNGQPASAAQNLVAAAQRPFHVRLGTDGGVLGYRFADGLDVEQRNFLRGLFAAYMHKVAPDAEGTWEAKDVDAAGEFIARFTLEAGADGDTAQVTRKKLRYEVLTSDQVQEHSIHGHSRATLSRGIGWLAAVAMDERTGMTIGELGLRVEASTVYKIELRAQSARPFDAAVVALWDEPWQAAAGHSEDFMGLAEGRERDKWRQRLEGQNLAGLVAELQALLAAKERDTEAVHAAWLGIIWMVRLRPDTAGEIRGMVVGMEAELADMLVSALGAAGTGGAQDVLADMRHDPDLSVDLRRSATISMFQLAKPSERVLTDLARDIGRAGELVGDDAMAVLLLGALAPRAGEARVGGQSALDTLLGYEDKASAQGRLDLWLNALGNAGTPEVLPHAERLTRHNDEMVRGAAYNALRQVKTPRALTVLQRGLSDPAPGVRADAVAALGEHRTPEACALLVRAARDDADPQVRQIAYRGLAPHARPGTAARQALEHAAHNDPDPETREMAARLLRGA